MHDEISGMDIFEKVIRGKFTFKSFRNIRKSSLLPVNGGMYNIQCEPFIRYWRDVEYLLLLKIRKSIMDFQFAIENIVNTLDFYIDGDDISRIYV